MAHSISVLCLGNLNSHSGVNTYTYKHKNLVSVNTHTIDFDIPSQANIFPSETLLITQRLAADDHRRRVNIEEINSLRN